jgi:hypothetical protein
MYNSNSRHGVGGGGGSTKIFSSHPNYNSTPTHSAVTLPSQLTGDLRYHISHY